ncbi:MAG: zinc-binding dehydrogenase [Chloroflexia bacterium]
MPRAASASSPCKSRASRARESPPSPTRNATPPPPPKPAAQRVLVSADGAAAAEFGPYDLIAESVGGATLGNALAMVAPGGTCVTFGPTSGAQITFDVSKFYMVGGCTLYGFILFHETRRRPAGAGLARLAHLVASGQLRTSIAVEASWKEIGTYAQQLLERSYTGKAVLHVD